MSEQHRIMIIDTFLCPSCKQTVTIGRSLDGDAIYHPLPACETYEKLSAKAYGELLLKHRS